MKKNLVIGGVRSGKSRYAEQTAQEYARQLALPVVYIATAEAFDDEMKSRIERHKHTRPKQWQTIESGPKLVDSLNAVEEPCIILIDCLTVWLNNCLYYQQIDWQEEKQRFLDWLTRTKHAVIMVSNEVGFSITPDNALARQFADEQGWLNQDVARIASTVTFTIAGIPHELKHD